MDLSEVLKRLDTIAEEQTRIWREIQSLREEQTKVWKKLEVSSHVHPSDVFEFRKKAEVYEKKVGVKTHRLMMVTPHADDAALGAGVRLGVEIYTKV